MVFTALFFKLWFPPHTLYHRVSHLPELFSAFSATYSIFSGCLCHFICSCPPLPLQATLMVFCVIRVSAFIADWLAIAISQSVTWHVPLYSDEQIWMLYAIENKHSQYTADFFWPYGKNAYALDANLSSTKCILIMCEVWTIESPIALVHVYKCLLLSNCSALWPYYRHRVVASGPLGLPEKFIWL